MFLKNYTRMEINFKQTSYALLQTAGKAPELQILMSKGELSP